MTAARPPAAATAQGLRNQALNRPHSCHRRPRQSKRSNQGTVPCADANFSSGAAAGLAASSPLAALAAEGPPLTSKAEFVAWMTANRPAEDHSYLERRWDRYPVLLQFNDLWTPADKRAFLMTPRQEFCLPENREDAYVGHYLDIGFGVTITPPARWAA